MHKWGDPDVDWNGISEAAYWIGKQLRRWGISVSDCKEKYGTVRVYCSLGRWGAPGPLNKYVIIPIQQRIYRWVYMYAVRRKWPHLAGEILMGADFEEYLQGIDPRFDLHWSEEWQRWESIWDKERYNDVP